MLFIFFILKMNWNKKKIIMLFWYLIKFVKYLDVIISLKCYKNIVD